MNLLLHHCPVVISFLSPLRLFLMPFRLWFLSILPLSFLIIQFLCASHN